MRIHAVAFTALLAASLISAGCGPTAKDTASPSQLAAQDNSTDPRLRDLAFMAGNWAMITKDGRSEETWSAPAGSGMTGSFRSMKPDGSVTLSEEISISAEPDAVYMRLRHFDEKHNPRENEPIVLAVERTVRGLESSLAGKPSAGDVATNMNEAVFRKVSGSQSLDSITYRLQGGKLLSEVAFTRTSGREPIYFQMTRVR
jgi:hypothetical protein